jgi:hypothetical protein
MKTKEELDKLVQRLRNHADLLEPRGWPQAAELMRETADELIILEVRITHLTEVANGLHLQGVR